MKVNKFSFKLKLLLLLSLIAAALCCTFLAFTINKNNTQTASAESSGTVVIYAKSGIYVNGSDAKNKVRITLDLSKKIYTTTSASSIAASFKNVEVYPTGADHWIEVDVDNYPLTVTCSLTAGYCDMYVSTGFCVITDALFTIEVWSNVTSVAVTTQPTQKAYTAGDKFNPSGMVLTATYGSRTETVANYTVTNGASLKAGQTSVTVSYTENGVTKTTTVPITVSKANPAVHPQVALTDALYSSSAMPAITTSTGDTAGTIEWTTTSLKAGANSCGWRFTPTDTANYNTVTGTYTLYAEEVEPVSLSADYNAGANNVFTTTTLEQLKSYIRLIATNNDGTTFEVPAEEYALSGTLTEGDCFIYILYYGLVNEVEITNVQNANRVTLSSLTAQFTDASKKEYCAYDKFNTFGVVVTAIYSDGTTKQVADYTFSYADITKDYLVAGDTYVNFKYTDGEESVNCQLRGLTVSKAKPTVTPNISLNEKLFAGDNIPKITLSEGDTAGSISWTETVLSEGTKSYVWNFVPADFNYDVASGSYVFTADKLVLESITATYAPEEGFKVTTATTLDEIRSRLTVNGLFNNGTPYTDIANFELFGTLKAGTSVLTVTYGGASATFEISDVELVKESAKVTPKVATNGLLIEGNALPNITLSAGDTLGTISWDDVDGEVAKLIAGEHSYNWTFTPDDADKYEVVTGTYVFFTDPVKIISLAITIPQDVLGTPIYPETSLEDLKELIVVTAKYNTGEVKTVAKEDYEIFATLRVGSSKIVVEYEGATGSRTVTVQSSEGGGVRVAVKWMSGAYVYDGSVHIPTPYIEWDGEKILLEAELVDGYDGTSAGTQKVAAVEPDSGKYLLTGETVMTYTITKAEISVVWTSEDGWTYNGEAQNPEAQVKALFNDGKIGVQFRITAKGGSALTDGKAVNAGTYIAEVVLTGTENYEVKGNTTFEFTISKKKVSKPSAMTNGFVYNGEEQTYIPVGYDGSVMTITGDKQSEAGEHVVTVTLKDTDNYEWADGTSQALSFTFGIEAPAVGESGIGTGAMIALIVVAVIALIVAIIAVVYAARKKAVAEDPDGFNDVATDEDLY